jgi:hypothetical protein
VIRDIFQNQEVVCYSLQDSKYFGSPIFAKYLNEEEKFPMSNFIYLSSRQPVYDSYAREVEEGSDGDLKGFYEQFTKLVPSLDVVDSFLEVNKPISDINGSPSSKDIKQVGIGIIEDFNSISHEHKTSITYREDIKQELSSIEIILKPCLYL